MTLTESDSLLEDGRGRAGDTAIPRGSLATAVLRIRRELSVSSGESEGGGVTTGSGSIRIPSWMATGVLSTAFTSPDDQASDGFLNPGRGSRPQDAHMDGGVSVDNSSAAVASA